MKLAFLLFGIHSMNYYNGSYGTTFEINYKSSLDNYKKTIFDFYKAKGYEIDVFISTYHSTPGVQKELIADYKPKELAFLPMTAHRFRGRNNHFRKVLSLCLNYSKKQNIMYDTVIITRFDLIFRDSFDDSKINYEALNLVSTLQLPHYICDNFYLLPFKLLSKFNDAVLSQNSGMSFHRLGPVFEKYLGPINFIKDEKRRIQHLSFYYILRKQAT